MRNSHDGQRLPQMIAGYESFPLSITGREGAAGLLDSLLAGVRVSETDNGGALTGPAVLLMQIVSKDNIALLLDMNADILPEFLNADGLSPLMIAAARGNLPAVTALLSHPLVDINRQGLRGMTALHFASFFGHADCVEALVSRHADINIADDKGYKPKDVSTRLDVDLVFSSRQGLRKKRAFTDAAMLPVKRQAAPAVTAVQPLHELLSASNAPDAKDLVSLLAPEKTALEDFEKIYTTHSRSVKAKRWQQLLIAAAESGNADIVDYLTRQSLAFPKDVLNAALHATLSAGDHPEIVGALVRAGASTSAKVKEGPEGGKGAQEKISLSDYAKKKNLTESFNEICIWGDRYTNEMSIDMELSILRLMRNMISGTEQKALYTSLVGSLITAKLRMEMKNETSHGMVEAMKCYIASGNSDVAIAIYVENMRKKNSWMSSKAEFGDDLMANFVQLLVEEGRYRTARDICRDMRLNGMKIPALDIPDNPEAKILFREINAPQELAGYRPRRYTSDTGPR